VYKPEGARGGIKHLVDHQARCGDYIIGDTEFSVLRSEELDGDSSDSSDEAVVQSPLSGTYDLALILVDCYGCSRSSSNS